MPAEPMGETEFLTAKTRRTQRTGLAWDRGSRGIDTRAASPGAPDNLLVWAAQPQEVSR